jgi:hypothetical protein
MITQEKMETRKHCRRLFVDRDDPQDGSQFRSTRGRGFVLGFTLIILALLTVLPKHTTTGASHLSGPELAIDQSALIDTVRRDPKAAKERFQLALLAEKRREWYEAVYWMEEFIKIDATSELAAKVQQELGYLRWVVLFEETPLGTDHRRSLDRLAEARAAFEQREWIAAGTKAYEALYADPGNYQAHIVTAAAAENLQRFDLAAVILRNAQLHAPLEQAAEINQAIVRCERLKTFGEIKIVADKAFAFGKRTEAADGYLKAWEAAPERSDAALSGVQAAVMGEDYPKARIILTKLEAAGTPPERLPPGLRDIPDLLSRLDRLEASAPQKSRSGPNGKSHAGSSSTKAKKTIAEDFLSRIKK